MHDAVCFHCQQSAEKYLKAILEELGLTVPRTHDLDHLLTQLLPHYGSLRRLRRGLVFLTDFAVDTRYPGGKATKRQAEAALRWAEQVQQAAQSFLGVSPHRPRRKSSKS